LNIKQLRYFIKICETKSFSKAAEQLYISQQGLSMAIMRLEQELSCCLFDRTTNGLMLTQDGDYLLPKATDIVKNTDECEMHFQKINQDSGSIKLYVTPSAISRYASDLFLRFQEANPQYSIRIHEGSDIMCDTAVETGQAELAFTLGPVDEKRFDCELVSSLQLYLLLSEDHPLASNDSLKIEALQSVPLTIMWDGIKIHSEMIKYCEDEGFIPEVRHMAISRECAYQTIFGGAAALMLHSDLLGVGEFSKLKGVPIDDERVRWNSYMIKKRGVNLSVGASEFEQFVLQNKPIDTLI